MCESYYTGSLSPNQPASETVAGVVEIATNNDVSAGTNDTKVITPLKLKNVTNDLQEQIDTLEASSDVKDIVGTYQDLLNYDTSTLGNNDIIKVLDDETHDNNQSYYRWIIANSAGAWSYIGSEPNGYTQAQVDNLFVPQTRTINGQPLSQDITIETPSTTPRFSVNTGNTNNQGSMDILDNSTNNILAFKVDDGTTYAPLVATDGYTGEQFTKTSLNPISMNAENVSAGTYNVFCPKNGNTPYLLNNTIFVQAEKPSDEPVDTIPVMTSNTTPYGTVTTQGLSGGNNFYQIFDRDNSHGENISSWGGTPLVTYTYDENYRPNSGTYRFSLRNGGRIIAVILTFTDGTTRTFNKSESADNYDSNIFSIEIPISSVSLRFATDGSWRTIYTKFYLQKPAILDEGTIWVNNGVEPLEVQARDTNGQWQPFNDVLMGTCTVNSSKTITAVTNQGFNYFSTVNMHNISTTAHKDIRANLEQIQTDIIQVNTQIATKTSKFTAQNTALTPTNNKVTWTITNSLNTADVMVVIRKVSDNSVVQADVTTTASTITITMNAESAVSANTYRAVVIG